MSSNSSDSSETEEVHSGKKGVVSIGRIERMLASKSSIPDDSSAETDETEEEYQTEDEEEEEEGVEEEEEEEEKAALLLPEDEPELLEEEKVPAPAEGRNKTEKESRREKTGRGTALITDKPGRSSAEKTTNSSGKGESAETQSPKVWVLSSQRRTTVPASARSSKAERVASRSKPVEVRTPSKREREIEEKVGMPITAHLADVIETLGEIDQQALEALARCAKNVALYGVSYGKHIDANLQSAVYE